MIQNRLNPNLNKSLEIISKSKRIQKTKYLSPVKVSNNDPRGNFEKKSHDEILSNKEKEEIENLLPEEQDQDYLGLSTIEKKYKLATALKKGKGIFKRCRPFENIINKNDQWNYNKKIEGKVYKLNIFAERKSDPFIKWLQRNEKIWKDDAVEFKVRKSELISFLTDNIKCDEWEVIVHSKDKDYYCCAPIKYNCKQFYNMKPGIQENFKHKEKEIIFKLEKKLEANLDHPLTHEQCHKKFMAFAETSVFLDKLTGKSEHYSACCPPNYI